MSLSPESTQTRSGSSASGGLELRLAHLARELAAHGEVRVAQVRLDRGARSSARRSAQPRNPSRRGAGPSALRSCCPRGRRSAGSSCVHATVAARSWTVRLFTRGGSRGAPCSSRAPRCSPAPTLAQARRLTPKQARALRAAVRGRVYTPGDQRLRRRPRRLQPPLGPRQAARRRPGRATPPTCAPSSSGRTATTCRSSPAPAATATTATRRATPRSSSTSTALERHRLRGRDRHDRSRRAELGASTRALAAKGVDDPRRLVPDGRRSAGSCSAAGWASPAARWASRSTA